MNQTACGTRQACSPTTNKCECAAEPRCGTPGAEGNFCPTAGGSSFSVCSKDANGCFYVSAENQACTAPMTCQVTGVVATGTACGCPANGTTLNSGCANVVSINTTLASASDNAVLRCETVGVGAGACKIWRILVNCADQSLTAGTDAVTHNPACVCKPAGSAPGAANAIYVDPSPPVSLSMTNGPTGAIQPAACRLPSITKGLAATNGTFTRVVAIHESAGSIHFPAETMPINIPPGVTVTTADLTFNTAHYTIDLGANGAARVALGNGSTISGFTLLGAMSGSTGNNAQGQVPAGVELLGCSTGTASASDLDIIGTGTHVGVSVKGTCVLTGTNIKVGGAGTGIDVTSAGGTASFTGTAIGVTGATVTGLVVGNATSSATITAGAGTSGIAATGATSKGIIIFGGTVALTSTPVTSGGAGASLMGGSATFTSSGITAAGTGLSLTGGMATLVTSPIASSGGTGLSLTGGTASLTTSPITAIGTGVGINGGAATLASSNVTVTGTGAIGVNLVTGTAGLTSSNVAVNGGGGTRGVVNAGGTVTLATSGITLAGAIDGTSRGIVQSGTSISVTGGTITLPAASAAAIGVEVTQGSALLAGVTETVGGNVTGIQVTNSAQLTVNGASVLTGANSGQGISVPAGAPQLGAVVNVGGTAKISGFQDGIVSGNGSLTLTGTAQVTGNVNAGIQAVGLPTAPGTNQVNITGATISGNGGDGILVSTNIPTTITTSTISTNKGSGVNVAQSQSTGVTGAKFTLTGSTISGNGTAGALPIGYGLLLGATAGKVSAVVEANRINTNVLEGVRVQGGTGTSPPLTEVALRSNHINGNLTAFTTAPATTIAGGIFFASGPIRLGQFVGNRVFANNSNQIGFAVAQDTSLISPAASAWDLSSGASGVDMATTCDVAAQPNYVYCYGGANSMPGTLGVAISNDPTIKVKAKGMHWAVAMPTATADFSNGIPSPTVLVPTEPVEGVFQSCSPAGAAGFCADIP